MPNKGRSHARPVTNQPLNQKISDNGIDAEADLKKSSREREARRKGASLSTARAPSTRMTARSSAASTRRTDTTSAAPTTEIS